MTIHLQPFVTQNPILSMPTLLGSAHSQVPAIVDRLAKIVLKMTEPLLLKLTLLPVVSG